MTTTVAEPPVLTQPSSREAVPRAEPTHTVSIICSKGTLDMAYPGLILANGARMTGIDANLFFTFWGMDIITEKKIDHLRTATVGNPSMPIPTMVGGLPGMESLATTMMKREMDKLEIPTVREMIEILHDSGARIYACRMAMEMFNLDEQDLVPQVDGVLSVMDFWDMASGSQIVFI